MPGRSTKRKPPAKEICKDASTQTTPDERDAEIIRLKEAMELLNQRLQQFDRQNHQQNVVIRKKLEDISPAAVIETPKSTKALGKGCNCKGKCDKKICGCVKKNIPCSEFCRCDNARCLNQEPDKENIGDPNSQTKLSADEERALQSLASLKLKHDNQVQAAVQVAGLANNRLNRAKESLFSPDNASSPETEFSLSVLDIDEILEFNSVKKQIEFGSETSPDKKQKLKNKKMDPLEVATGTRRARVAAGKPLSDKPKKKKLLSPFYNDENKDGVFWDIDRSKSESPVEKYSKKRGNVMSNEQVSSTQRTPSPRIAGKLEDFDDDLEFSSIDPMKPTRQLPRTPVTGSSPRDELQQSDGSVSTSEQDSAKELSTLPKDKAMFVELDNGGENVSGEYRFHPKSRSTAIGIEAPVVDWEEHCAQLVPCKLCRRKFYPHRIPKHEASCKKL